MDDREQLIDDYRRSRDLLVQLHTELTKRIERKALMKCARKLGFSRDGTLVFDSMSETNLLVDYCLYDHRPTGHSIVEKHAAKCRGDDPERSRLLRAMAGARYSLFSVRRIEKGLGATLLDILADQELFLMDLALGRGRGAGAAIAARLIDLGPFWMTTGAMVPLDRAVGEQVALGLARAMPNRVAEGFRGLTPRERSEFSAIVIRTCREAGLSSAVEYEQFR